MKENSVQVQVGAQPDQPKRGGQGRDLRPPEPAPGGPGPGDTAHRAAAHTGQLPHVISCCFESRHPIVMYRPILSSMRIGATT